MEATEYKILTSSKMLKNNDLWLWACLGIFGFFAARTCHKQLSAVRTATESSPEESIDDSENDGSRNDPSLEDLARLARGPNVRTREAAIRVIESMVLRHQTFCLMLDHIVGKNKQLRDEALGCLRFMCSNKRPHYPDPYISIHICVTQCLCDMNSEAYDYETAFRETGHGYRTPPYSDALSILIRLIRIPADDNGLLAWLESYPFGGHSIVEDKNESIRQLMTNKYREEKMYVVVLCALKIPAVEDGLIRSNLIDREMKERCKNLWIRFEDVGNVLDDSPILHNPRDLPTFQTDLAFPRVREWGGGSFGAVSEQWHSRRQRREAAVVGQVGRPFEAEDIFVPSVYDTDIEPLDLSLSPGQS